MLKSTNSCMQRRRKLDQYLSYLSAPPLPCCCSSLWSPERRRQATRSGWTDGRRTRRKRRQPHGRVWMWVTWAAVGHVWTHRRPDGQTGRADDSLPGAQTSQDASIRAATQSQPETGLVRSTSLQISSFPEGNMQKLKREQQNSWSFSFQETESLNNTLKKIIYYVFTLGSSRQLFG